MLTYTPMANYEGIILTGDYMSLRQLQDIVHDVDSRSSLVRAKEDFFLALAYDLRKACEGARKKFPSPEGYPEIGPRFGVPIVWPAILMQARQLRNSLSFMEHEKRHQAAAYELEWLLETAIKNEFRMESDAILEQWQRIDTRLPYAESNIRTRLAVFDSWSKSERRKGLASLLASLDPIYPFLYAQWTRNGVENLVSPEEFERW